VGTLKLTDVSGKEIRIVPEVTARWRDGSIKWALLDFQADLRARSTEEFNLSIASDRSGSSTRDEGEVRVSKEGDAIRLENGILSFRVSSTGGGIPEDVKLNGKPVTLGGRHELDYIKEGPALNAPESRGNWKRQAPNASKIEALTANGTNAVVSVEQQNSLRATVLVKGWFEGNGRKACRFDVRLTLFAGKPWIKIQHTFTYTEDPRQFFVRRLDMAFKTPDATTIAFGGEGTQVHEFAAAAGARLIAPGPAIHHNGILLKDADTKIPQFGIVSASEGGGKAAGGKQPQGFVGAWNDTGGLILAVRDFSRLLPKQLSADKNGMTVGLWPSEGNLVIDCRNSGFGQRIREETTLEGVACGWAKTHEIWALFFGPSGPERAAALTEARAIQEPAWGAVDPEHVCESRAMGILAPRDAENFPGMERQHDTLWAWVSLNRDVFHWDGFFDYGGILMEFDNHGQRFSGGARNTWVWRDYAGWILNDGQVSHHIFRGYARSGWRPYLKLGEAVARNIGDETTVHHFNPAVKNAHPVGSAHRHDMLPWGAIVTTYGMDVLGNCDLWFLTGDLRARDVLRDYAVNLSLGGFQLKERHGICSLLCRLGEALNDASLIQAAKKYLKKDLDEALKPGFRTWTDVIMPMILAADILDDDTLHKGLLDAANNLVEKPSQYGGELAAWAFMQSREPKYLAAMKQCLARNPNIDVAANNRGDPWQEDWASLRKRMGQMPAWYVKVYINTQLVGRYPAVIKALQTAGLTETEFLSHQEALK
jgi:hypothetical protein